MDHLEQLFKEADVAILYLYCDYKDKHNQTDRNLLASLAKQSVLQQADISQEATALYSQCRRGQKSLSLENYVALLKSSMKYFRRTFIVIDALDEHLTLDENEPSTHIPLLYHLYSLQKEMPQRCTMLITSRESDFIRNELHNNTRLEIRAKDEDIQAYVNSRIHNNFAFAENVKANTDLANAIAKKVVEKAQGM